jgi:hypothetical protein
VSYAQRAMLLLATCEIRFQMKSRVYVQSSNPDHFSVNGNRKI